MGAGSWPRRILRALFRLGLLGALVLALLVFTPTKWVMRAPGNAMAVATMIRIPGQKTYPSMGRLYLTTVLVEPASALLCLYALVDSQAELVDREGGDGPAPPVTDPRVATQMQQSQYLAKVAALRYLGHEISAEPVGAEMMAVLPRGPARDALFSSDVVVEAAGKPVRDAQGLREILLAAPGGAPIAMKVLREGEEVSLEVPTEDRDGHAFLGVSVRTRVEEAPLPFVIDIEAGSIDGASAGLMFALEIVDLLTPQDLTRGRLVAGTGTVGADGAVGEIRGVDMKVRGAEEVGAAVFLCPRENEAEARAAATRVQVIPVGSLEEAIKRLQEGP